jgi:hypothetical protein
MNYPAQAEELIRMLEEDQKEWIGFARVEFESSNNAKEEWAELKQRAHQRAERMLQILSEVGEPTLSNIGKEGAEAVFVLAQHDTLATLRKVLTAFTKCYESQRNNAYYKAIPPMTDRMLILERKPQRFGAIWLQDDNKEPFLPSVEDFENVNKRRAEYDIGPLRWPKSLAIPESKQPWLKRPLSELVTRELNDKEYKDFTKEYLG